MLSEMVERAARAAYEKMNASQIRNHRFRKCSWEELMPTSRAAWCDAITAAMVPRAEERAQAEAIVEAFENNDLEGSLVDEIAECLGAFYRSGVMAERERIKRGGPPC